MQLPPGLPLVLCRVCFRPGFGIFIYIVSLLVKVKTGDVTQIFPSFSVKQSGCIVISSQSGILSNRVKILASLYLATLFLLLSSRLFLKALRLLRLLGARYL